MIEPTKFKGFTMVKVVEQKQDKGTLLCIYDIPGNVMGSELDKFLCIAHLFLMGDGERRHLYLEKLGPSNAPTGYSMLISNELMNGEVKFPDREIASDIVRSRFGAEYVGEGIKFVEALKEWLANNSWKSELYTRGTGVKLLDFLVSQIARIGINVNWTQAEHVQDIQLDNLQSRTVVDALQAFGKACSA